MSTKLNLGPGRAWSEPGWDNLDITLGYDLRERLLRGYPDGSVDTVYTSHCLEHLEFAEAAAVVRDAHRALRPGGVLRVVVPDADELCHILLKEDIEYLVHHNPGYYDRHRHVSYERHVEQLFGWDRFTGDPDPMHRSFYSFSTMAALLRFSGFFLIKRQGYCQSVLPELERPATLDAGGMPVDGFDNVNTAFMSLFVEAVR